MKAIKSEQFFSPNGDKWNETWVLEDLKEYSEKCLKGMELKNKVEIFNRWGTKIFEKNNYMTDDERFSGESQNGWDIGEVNLPMGTYFFILKVKDKSGVYVINKTGYIYLGK